MSLRITLSPGEARVIGCLIEKQITTPDQYPLSLNALTNACNQKSNRDPLLALTEAQVQQLLDGLIRKHVVVERSGFGSRVAKFQHCFCNTEFSDRKFTLQELAIVCELLLRGAQTAGELRTRASRMTPFTDTADVEATLEALAARPDGAVVVRLARQAGRRDARYQQLFTGEPTAADLAPPGGVQESAAPLAAPADYLARLERLEHEVQALRVIIERLRPAPQAAGAAPPPS